jgi:hypothetical protein
MAYYYPIILRRYSYRATLDADKVLLVRRLSWPKIIGEIEVLSKSEGILNARRFSLLAITSGALPSYVHHIL